MYESLIQKAQTLKQDGQVNDAVEILQQAIAQAPQNMDAYRQLGDLLFNEQTFDEAAKTYQKVIELAPKMPYPYFRLGQICKKRQQWADATDYYQQAIALNPKNPWFYKELGDASLAQDALDEAETALQTAIELKPDLQDAHFQLGITQQRQEKLDESIASFESLLELNSNHFGGNQHVGDIYVQKKEFESAISYYQKAIEIRNDNPFLYAKLARALQNNHQFDLALNTWNIAIRLKADRYQFHQQLGDLRLQQEDIAGAIASYEKAIALNPDLPSLNKKLNTALQKQALSSIPRHSVGETPHPAKTMGSIRRLQEVSKAPIQEQNRDERDDESLLFPRNNNSGTADPELFRKSGDATEENEENSLDIQEMPITVELDQAVKHGKGGGASGKATFNKYKRRNARNATVDNIGFQKDFRFSAESVGGYDEGIPEPIKKVLLLVLLGFYGAIAIGLFLKGLTVLSMFMVAIACVILLVFWGFRQLK